MYLRSRLLPRQSTSNPLDNRAHRTTNVGQAPYLDGIHREMHGITEQIRIMNEINSRLATRIRRIVIVLVRDIQQGADTTSEETRRCGRSSRWDDRVHRYRDKSTTQNFKDLDARIDTVNTGGNAPVTVDALIRQTESPFIERVMKVRISFRFKLPSQLGVYEGKTDPMDHLGSYKDLMCSRGIQTRCCARLFQQL
ncbi:hypothetical protein Acr_29g0000280 [Actinidia rufa]|uniref:Uncharacterized protein n=1 Tax=Actinidia rufa TaxID=165716 RepID=A0A7J0HCP2_9ERIC|nr:hypothetical protein Acr_29g0000280 [Actinidia rufa]